MKQVQKVWAELSAKPQKVELGIIQDVIKEYKQGMDLFTSGFSSIDRASEILTQAERLYEKAEQQAKDLGVDMGSQTEKFGNKLKSNAKEARKIAQRK